MRRYNPPVLLAGHHQLGGFRCRSNEQTHWLVDLARQSHGSGTSRVLVVTEHNEPVVVAYYAWCMASVAMIDPVALLTRLGVDQGHERQSLGAALLIDAITRVGSLSDAIGCRGLLVHAESEQARGFYEHLIPEWERSPTDPLHLLLLLKDIRRTLAERPM
jgi:GNAT superfamily N-acetyltransferase